MPQRDSVYSLVVSPDGRRLGAVTNDGVRFWDLATRARLAPLHLPLQGVRVVAFSPDGRRLAAGGDGPKVLIAGTAGGEPIAELTGFSGRIQSLAFSPDGRQLLTAGKDPTLRLWDATTGRMVRTFAGHSLEVLAAVFHPDGTRIASGGHDRSICLWDTATGEELVRLPGSFLVRLLAGFQSGWRDTGFRLGRHYGAALGRLPGRTSAPREAQSSEASLKSRRPYHARSRRSIRWSSVLTVAYVQSRRTTPISDRPLTTTTASRARAYPFRP